MDMWEGHFTDRKERHKERQVEPQVAVGATHVSYLKFVKYQPLTFFKMDILENP